MLGIVEVRRPCLGLSGGGFPQKRDLHPTDKDPSVGAQDLGHPVSWGLEEMWALTSTTPQLS